MKSPVLPNGLKKTFPCTEKPIVPGIQLPHKGCVLTLIVFFSPFPPLIKLKVNYVSATSDHRGQNPRTPHSSKFQRHKPTPQTILC